MTRHALPFASAVLAATALLAFAPPASCQLNPGVHVARAHDFAGGANGVGGSLELSFPLVPIDLFVAGDYFFPDCGGRDCGLWGGSADVHFTLPFPILTPYGTAGLVYRKSTVTDLDVVSTGASTGFGLGAGVNLGTLVLGAYLEARYEFVNPDDQFVIRLGVRF